MATDIFRSVGITATDLNTGAATVEIVGSTATFSAALPDNIGIGDALEVGATPTLAFIHARVSASVFTVKDKAGAAPAAAGAGSACGIFRAYITAANWESQTENTNINATIRDFDISTDLVANDIAHRVACYNDGVETTSFVISGWTTDATRNIKIFTPVTPTEVGVSQRHSGVNASGYQITSNSQALAIIQVSVPFVTIEGLALHLQTGSALSDEGIRFDYDSAAQTGMVHECVISADTGAGDNDGIYMDNHSGTITVENCIIYGFTRAAIHAQNFSGVVTQTWTVKNCTLVGNGATGEADGGGINLFKSAGSAISITVTNTIAMDTVGPSDDFNIGGTAVAGDYTGDFCISSDASVTTLSFTNSLASRTASQDLRPGTGDFVTFFCIPGPVDHQADLHLKVPDDPADNDAINAGTDSGMPTTDIDGRGRVSPFDIGATEAGAALKVLPGMAGGMRG